MRLFFLTLFPTLRRRALGLSAVVILAVLGVVPAPPADADSGLPVPRFVSLRAPEVNARTGPGVQYPVEWVFLRQHMPVEVVAEFDTWRRIRDFEGTEGWVHQSLLAGRRSFVVTGGALVPLRHQPSADAPAVALLEPGVIGRLLRCPDGRAENGAWCHAEIDGYRGWLPRGSFWGTYEGEEVR